MLTLFKIYLCSSDMNYCKILSINSRYCHYSSSFFWIMFSEKVTENICFTAKTTQLYFLWKMKNSWIESPGFLFLLAALNRSISKTVINFWKSMVTTSLRLPLEESKINNKPRICRISFVIVRGNRLLKIICICTINEKVSY